MTRDVETDPTPEQVDWAHECIEKGISEAQAGRYAAAVDLFDEAERIGAEVQSSAVVVSARINKGWAAWSQGDVDAARRLYADAAEIARDTEDDYHLSSALLNFGTASRQVGRWEESIAAYEELLPVVAEDPATSARVHLDCGLSYAETGEFEAASAHVDEAARLATQEELTELVVSARIDQGVVLERRGDRVMALVSYEEAARLARAAGLRELLALALVSAAQGHRMLGGFSEADPLFIEAEDVYRSLGQREGLADALYWHGVALRGAGMRDRAMAAWREEEPVRRELEQLTDLGDCLFEQAGVLRDREEWGALEVLYPQIEDAYRRGGSFRGLAETLLLHGRMLRTQGRLDEALDVAEQALVAALEADAADTECRIRGMRAMAYADLGGFAEARLDLDEAEAAGVGAGLIEQATWIMARRAYVFAREDEAADEVVLQLRTALAYGSENGQPDAGRKAVRRMIAEIRASGGEGYEESLAALKEELRAARPEEPATDTAPEEGQADIPESADGADAQDAGHSSEAIGENGDGT